MTEPPNTRVTSLVGTLTWFILGTAGTALSAQAPPLTGLEELFGSSAEAPFGSLNPEAPAETDQYAFMVGLFDCTLVDREFRAGEWVQVREGRATWRARYVMNGLAIMDEFWNEWGSWAVNVRIYSPEEGLWKVHYTARENPAGAIFDAREVDGAMVMDADRVTDSGFEYVQRFAFHPDGDDRYRWTNEVVYDDGTSVTIGTIDCARRSSPNREPMDRARDDGPVSPASWYTPSPDSSPTFSDTSIGSRSAGGEGPSPAVAAALGVLGGQIGVNGLGSYYAGNSGHGTRHLLFGLAALGTVAIGWAACPSFGDDCSGSAEVAMTIGVLGYFANGAWGTWTGIEDARRARPEGAS